MGCVERANYTLMSKIKKLSDFGRLEWTNVVEKATFAVNISFNRAIGTSPIIMKDGKHPILEIDKRFNTRHIKVDLERIKGRLKVSRSKYDKEERPAE